MQLVAPVVLEKKPAAQSAQGVAEPGVYTQPALLSALHWAPSSVSSAQLSVAAPVQVLPSASLRPAAGKPPP